MAALIIVAAALYVGPTSCWTAEPTPKQIWLYSPTNLLVNENIDKLEALWRRAAKAGYTHIYLTDTKFNSLQNMPKSYFQNVERVKQLAAELHLELVPGVFPIGWSNALLHNDPNLAEALPVKDALFVVKNGEARLVADPPVSLPSTTDLKRWSWKDEFVTADEGGVRISEPNGRVGRLVKTVTVTPFRQYHISVRIKTRDFRGHPEIKVLADNQALNYNDLGVKPTQDWSVHHTVFNSLEHKQVNIYFGCWDGRSGAVWYADPKLEEVGLLNVVRRPGAPLTVRRESDPEDKLLVEGRDFEPVADPKMGQVPYQGEYEVWHETPPIRTSLPDGTRLRVSYYHPMIIYGGSVMIALSEPKTLELLRDSARRVNAAFGAKAYFMEHDEIRIFNWDKASVDRNLDAGALLADNVRTCTKILHDVAPDARLYIWSDMFDPTHNAVKNYYLVRGSIAGSWEGVDPSITIADWGFEKRDASLKFFAGRGHHLLIAAYYDAPLENTRKWLDSAQNVRGVDAVMYTTWQNNFSEIEHFAETVKQHPWYRQ